MFVYLSPLLTDIHGAGATDALPAGPPEGQAGVHLVLDLDEGVQDHGAAVIKIHLVVLHLRLVPWLLRVPPVDSEDFLLLRAEAPGPLLLRLGGGGRGPPHGEVERSAGSQRQQLGGGVHCHDSKTVGFSEVSSQICQEDD